MGPPEPDRRSSRVVPRFGFCRAPVVSSLGRHAPGTRTRGKVDIPMKSGLEIAQEASLLPITDVAAAAGIEPDELERFGTYRAKISLDILERLKDRPDGKLVITTAITPTKAG